ncbi:hypothetical protein BJX64DRAFT_11934 [Aspergillus heterothallicus]
MIESRFSHLEKLNMNHENILDQILAWVSGKQTANQPQLTPMKTYSGEPATETDTKKQTAAEGPTTAPAHNYVNGLIQNQNSDDGELSIPVEHTTAAHKLLGWPTISTMLKPHNYDEDYVMKLEESRTFMLIHGRGDEVLDEGSSSGQTSFNTSFDEGNPDTSSPNGAFPHKVKYNETPQETPGIDGFGFVTLEPETARRYLQSYLESLHKLHPFLNQQDLVQKTELFIESYCTKPGQTGHVAGHRNSIDVPRGAKRKRSGETLQASAANGHPSSTTPVASTLPNAVVLLVLALGRICEVRDQPIRGPCTDRIIDYRKEPIPRARSRQAGSMGEPDALSNTQGSFYSPYQNHSSPSLPSLDDKYITLPDPPGLQNVDTVPGLALYAFAARILGTCGTTSLSFVQAALLAGLYTGQLAHPFKSHDWILQAARACLVLIRPPRYNNLPSSQWKDLVRFAFWTCLQLERCVFCTVL